LENIKHEWKIPEQRETTHPGEHLKEILESYGINQSEFARRLGVTHCAINEIINGKRSVSPRMAQLMHGGLGISAMFWMNMQAMYDLTSKRINKKQTPKLFPEVKEYLKSREGDV